MQESKSFQDHMWKFISEGSTVQLVRTAPPMRRVRKRRWLRKRWVWEPDPSVEQFDGGRNYFRRIGEPQSYSPGVSLTASEGCNGYLLERDGKALFLQMFPAMQGAEISVVIP